LTSSSADNRKGYEAYLGETLEFHLIF